MKLVLYSGGIGPVNKALDYALLENTNKDKPQMTYVPFTYYEHPRYFNQFKKYFSAFGVEDFIYMAPNKAYSNERIRKAFASDIIYLSTGNTFTFLKNLREQKLVAAFKKFVKRGGILAGASAGAIVMTPNIMTALVPQIDSDVNHTGLRNLNALNLVGFEFSPHFDGDTSEELRSYSRFTPFPVLACNDGAGLVINEDRIKVVGEVFRFKNGRKTVLDSLNINNL